MIRKGKILSFVLTSILFLTNTPEVNISAQGIENVNVGSSVTLQTTNLSKQEAGFAISLEKSKEFVKSNENDFLIESEVLAKYTGNASEVVVPDEITTNRKYCKEDSDILKYKKNNGIKYESVNKVQIKTYNIKFDANGGIKLSQSSRTVKEGSAVGTLPTVIRKDYTFIGWYTLKSGGSKITTATKITKAQTFYARWSKTSKPRKAKTPTLKYNKGNYITVSYSKVSDANGYEISYSTSKNFTMFTTKKVDVTSIKTTIYRLKKKTTYYVKVRAYNLDSAKNHIYGSFSEVKSVQIE